MSLFIRLGLHFICKKNSRKLSFTSWISILGVGFGVAAFLVIVTILNSFEIEMKHLIASINPNLVVFSPSGIPDAPDYAEKLKTLIGSPLEKSSPFVYQESTMGFSRATSSAYIRAIPGSKSASADQLAKFISPQGALATLDQQSSLIDDNRRTDDKTTHPNQLPHVILGKDLATSLGVTTGQVVQLMTFSNEGQQLSVRYNKLFVSGLIDLGIAQYNKQYALMNFEDGVKLFGAPSWASGIEIKLKDPAQALHVAQEIKDKIEYHTVAWQQIDSRLFYQIERDSMSIKLIVLIISLVAGFNIVITLILTITNRTKEIALLRSLGARKQFITFVFVLAGTFLGLIGSVFGCVVGMLLLVLFSGLSIGDFQKFYYLEKIPVHYEPVLFFAGLLTALLLSFLGSLYPAWRASRIDPVVGMRE